MAFISVDSDNSLVVHDVYEERDVVSDAGGRWDSVSKVWRVTFTLENLEHLLDKLDSPEVSPELELKVAEQQERERKLERLRSMSKSDVPVSLRVPSLRASLYNYQRLGVMYSVTNGTGVLLADEMGLGKAQPLDAKILTPGGWKRMGDMRVGDVVVDEYGREVKVTGVFPQGEKDVFRVSFSDGSGTECCEEHLWRVNTACRKNRGDEPLVLPLREIVRLGLTKSNGKNGLRNNWYIPMVGPMEFSRSGDLDVVPPYVMGILLGDGGLSCKRLGFSSADQEILDKALSLMPSGWKFRKTNSDYGYELCLPGANQTNPVHALFRRYGLKGKMTYEKHIPESYLFSPSKDRLELLRGLMDTDGTVGVTERGNVAQFCTTSEHLRDGMVFLCRSLGGVAHVSSKVPFYRDETGRKVICRKAWIVTVSLPSGVRPFGLKRKDGVYPNERKKYAPTRAMVSVVRVGRKPCQCISVDSESGLYVTDDFIVTHNTIQAMATAIFLKHVGRAKNALIVTPASLKFNWPLEIEKFTDEKYVVVDGTPEERIAQWLRMDVFFYVVNAELLLEDLFGGREFKESDDDTPAQKARKLAQKAKAETRQRVLSGVRGRTWDFVAVDEAQMLKHHSSRRTKNVKALNARFRMALTGTPMDGRLEELHSIMGFVAPGLLCSKTRFFQRYVETDLWGKVTGYKRLGEVSKKIQPFFLRRLKRDVLKDLPDKIYENRLVSLTPKESKIYSKLAENGHEATEDAEAIVAIIRCKQFCNLPRMVDEECEESSKMDSFKEVIEEVVVQSGHKVLVFTQYKEMLDVLAKELSEMGVKFLRIDGGTPKDRRAEMQREFNEDKTIDAMIGTEAMSTGLNFTAADYVLNYDDNWSPAIMAQREDRAHRIGQRNVVTVVNFICKSTVEERIRSVIYQKNRITSQVLGDETEEMVLQRLGPKDMIKLL